MSFGGEPIERVALSGKASVPVEILDCVFCLVAIDENCPCCAGYGVGAIDPEKGLRPLTDAEFLAACEASIDIALHELGERERLAEAA